MEHKKETLTMPQSILISGVLIAVAVTVGAILIVRAVSSKNTGVADAESARVSEDSVNIGNVIVDNEPYIGSSKPKAVLAYWCDYRSSVCEDFEGGVLQKIVQRFVVEGGDTAVLFKDNVTGGEASNLAALYGRAMWELYPAHYFVWRESMFEAAHKLGDRFGDDASILKLTGTIPGVDVEKVTLTLTAKRNNYQVLINNDAFEAKTFKITKEPGMITGNTLMQGATSYEKLSSLISTQLK